MTCEYCQGEFDRVFRSDRPSRFCSVQCANLSRLPVKAKYRGGGKHGQHHVRIATQALGKPLPPKSQVHHVDGDGLNNANSNLVICQDMAYHKLLHARTRIVKVGGNPNTQRICGTCKRLRLLSEMAKSRFTCRECKAKKADESRRARGVSMSMKNRKYEKTHAA